ncbi:MAG: NAD(P)-dependent oxidoreductase [Pseudomonadota bacterium]|nr:NAD(P)-dependent oxidoreductase [Pseudomonadota bacterium]
MTVTVGLFDAGYTRLKDRIDAMGLDIEIRAFDEDGNFDIGGAKVPAADAEIDYLWLGPDLAGGSLGSLPFDVALACKRIDVLQTFNAGLDNPSYKKLSDKGIRICNSSAQSVAIAEYTMAQALSLIHPIDDQRAAQAKKEWTRTPFREVANTTWLIVGFGPIGSTTAARAKAFGATVNVIRRSPQTSEIVDAAGTMDDLERFLPNADVIVLACPLNDATRGFAGEAFFANIKQGAILINIARGALIDDSAMIAALDRGQLEAAALDVFHTEPLPADDPLWGHPKIRVTAHTSFAGDGTRLRWDELFFDNLPRFVRGEPLMYEVAPADIV